MDNIGKVEPTSIEYFYPPVVKEILEQQRIMLEILTTITKAMAYPSIIKSPSSY